jgi:hypothetical protein
VRVDVEVLVEVHDPVTTRRSILHVVRRRRAPRLPAFPASPSTGCASVRVAGA